ncbi:GHKL domain-containing protein [Listeria booriae]|uniref:histidine kinase n=1 Tax=Listeria booriae TaxID=1552123 RepID=A0A7X1D8T5_9LIST|nr:sensor histidine kinase [Listeria booriae]MBC2176651.1 GHKL domain-containing protein [Listeria booriae]
MVKVPFDVDAYTARLIGRENVSKLEGAIIELVKNAYDADASKCIIYFDDVTKTLILADNGVGMTEDIIMNNWMTIGRSSKKQHFMSKEGRIQTGAKGIGRFALDRISNSVHMLTANQDNTLEWIIDWEEFSDDKKISETYAELYESNLSILEFIRGVSNNSIFESIIDNQFRSTGSIFIMSNLREEWNEKVLKNIRKSLSLMIPPTMEQIFEIYLFDNRINEKEAYIKSEHEDSYDYKIDFRTIEDDAKVEIMIHRNEFDFRGKILDVMRNGRFTKSDEEYFGDKPIVLVKHLNELVSKDYENVVMEIGGFQGSLYFFKNSTTKMDTQKYYYKDFTGRKQLNEKFGGIKIYRDNFWVRPYGERESSNYDWLLLSNRKGKSPAAVSHATGAWRVNADQMYGQIYISRLNLHLEDQSNREGIVESIQFKAFREILVNIIKQFEEDRQYVIRKLRSLYEQEHEAEKLERELKEKIKEQEKRDAQNRTRKKKSEKDGRSYKKVEETPEEQIPLSKIKPVVAQKDSAIEVLTNENKMLRAMATTGISINTYFHEITTLINDLHEELYEVQASLENKNISEAIEGVKQASKYSNKFQQWYEVTVKSVKSDKRTRKKWEIDLLIEALCASWQSVLTSERVDIQFIGTDEGLLYRCFPFEIESVVNNLISNSISAFDSVCQQYNRKILVELKKLNKGFKIIYSDKGPGLPDKYKKNPREILIPLETGKTDGTGLGMWIVDTIVKDYNGEVNLSKNSLQKGFRVEVSFE